MILAGGIFCVFVIVIIGSLILSSVKKLITKTEQKSYSQGRRDCHGKAIDGWLEQTDFISKPFIYEVEADSCVDEKSNLFYLCSVADGLGWRYYHLLPAQTKQILTIIAETDWKLSNLVKIITKDNVIFKYFPEQVQKARIEPVSIEKKEEAA